MQLGNIIFEDSRTAVLIQNKNEVMRIDFRYRVRLVRLLDAFFERGNGEDRRWTAGGFCIAVQSSLEHY